MIRRGNQGEQVRKREKGVELTKIAVLALVLRADERTQEQIAQACQALPDGKGITKSVLSEYANEKRQIGETHLRVIAEVVGVRPELLAKNLTKKQVVQAVEEKVAEALEPTPAAIDAAAQSHASDVPANVYPLDRKLKPMPAPDAGDSCIHIPVYSSIAAGGLDDEDTVKEYAPLAIPEHLERIQGARTFAVRIKGRSMVKAGIEPGDVLLIRRSSGRPKDGSIVIAWQHGGTTCKRLVGDELIAESPVHEDPITVDGDSIVGLVLAIFKP